MSNNFLYAADNAGPLLTFDGEYRMRRHRELEIPRRVSRVVRWVVRQLPHVRITATR